MGEDSRRKWLRFFAFASLLGGASLPLTAPSAFAQGARLPYLAPKPSKTPVLKRETKPAFNFSSDFSVQDKNYPYCIQPESRSHDRGRSWRDDLDNIIDYNREQYLKDVKVPKYCETSDLKWIISHYANHNSAKDILVLSVDTGMIHQLSRSGILKASYPFHYKAKQKLTPAAAMYSVSTQSSNDKRLRINDAKGNKAFDLILDSKTLPGDLKDATLIVSNSAQTAWASINGKLVQQPITACYVGDEIPLPVKYVNHNPENDNDVSKRFLKTLAAFKPKLMTMYHLTNNEYDTIAKMAFGILGNETDFGDSFKYSIKEGTFTSWIVPLMKSLQGSNSARSRGLIQMKNIPDSLANTYPELKDNPDLLLRPDYAALAAVAYLSETLTELRHRKDDFNTKARLIGNENRIQAWTEFDFLPYLYMGRNNAIKDGTATPDQNIYVKNLKKIMAKVSSERYVTGQ